MAIQQGQITITGFMGNEPQLYGVKDGQRAVCNFRVGSSRRYLDKQGQWQQLPTTWVTVKAFRTLAMNIMGSFHRGDPVIVTGVLSTEQWRTEDGEVRSRTLIEASNAGHDLNYGVSMIRKMAKDNTATQPPQNGLPAEQTSAQGADGDDAAAEPVSLGGSANEPSRLDRFIDTATGEVDDRTAEAAQEQPQPDEEFESDPGM